MQTDQTTAEPRHFDLRQLAEAVEKACPEVVFAFLLGSARDGVVRPGGDIDIAVYTPSKPTLEFYNRLIRAVEQVAPFAEVHPGILNRANPIYRFEALKGRRLFVRDMAVYAEFFSITCREYETRMFEFARQRRYRLEASQAKQQSGAHRP